MKNKGEFFIGVARGGLMVMAFALVALCAVFITPVRADAKPFAFPKGATYVGNDTCATCHEEDVKHYPMTTHGKLQLKGMDDVAEGCETCHGPGSIHVENGGGKGVGIINPKNDPRICFTCHAEKKMEFSLPSRHPVLEGKMSCSDCHDLHGVDATPSGTSLESVNETCFKCHKDQQGPFVYEHDALKEGCTVCHKVHGSVNDKMLVARDNNLCMRCHTQTNGPNIIGGASGHTSRMQNTTCYTAGCHTDLHGSNYEPAFRY